MLIQNVSPVFQWNDTQDGEKKQHLKRHSAKTYSYHKIWAQWNRDLRDHDVNEASNILLYVFVGVVFLHLHIYFVLVLHTAAYT